MMHAAIPRHDVALTEPVMTLAEALGPASLRLAILVR